MKVLIVGGGVAGTALAGFLKDRAEITLIDKAPKLGDVGYAISLWGTGRKILKFLGAEKEVVREGYEVPWDVFADESGDVLKDFTFKAFRPYGPTLVVPRSSLHKALISQVGKNIDLRLGLTIKHLQQTKFRVYVTFSNGQTDFFDLVVGADGIHSQVRELVFGKNFLKYYGWKVWALWTPKGVGFPKGAIQLASGGRMYFIYPLDDRAVIMFAAALPPNAPDPPEIRRENLKKLFADFKESVGHMIEAVPDPAHIFHDNLAYVDLNAWYKGRVVLMGDAQHATSPITGMGASMAMEDAYVLSEELKQVGVSNIDRALQNYENRRNRRIRKFRKQSHIVERFMLVKSPFLSFCRKIVLRFIPVSFFVRAIENLLKEEI